MPTNNTKVKFHYINTTAPASYDTNTIYFDNINNTLRVGENIIANRSYRPIAVEYSSGGSSPNGAQGTSEISAAQIYQTFLNNSDSSRIVATVVSNGGYNELPLVHTTSSYAIFAALEYNKCENQYALVEGGPNSNNFNPQIIYVVVYDQNGSSYYLVKESTLNLTSAPLEIKLSEPGYFAAYENTNTNIPHTGPTWTELYAAGIDTEEIHLIVDNGGYNKERYTSYSLDNDGEVFYFFAPASLNLMGFYLIDQGTGTDFKVIYKSISLNNN